MLDEKPAGVGVYIQEIIRPWLGRAECTLFTERPEALPGWLQEVSAASCVMGRPVTAGRAEARLRRQAWLLSVAPGEALRRNLDAFFSPIQEGMFAPSIPQVVVVHDLTALRYPVAFTRGHVFTQRYLLTPVLQRCAKVVAVSRNTARDLTAYLGIKEKKIEVIGEGVDRSVFGVPSTEQTEEFRARYRLPAQFLGYVGTFSRHKNLERLLEVLSEIPEVMLVMAGRSDAGDFARFERIARTLGVWERVKVLDYIPKKEVPFLMSAASAFVFPSHYEGFGLAVLEALASGAWVISSNAASLPEVVGDGGDLLPPDQPAPWLEATRKALAATPEERAQRQGKAVAQAARFSWKNASAAILKTIQEASAKKLQAPRTS